ncbi:hypothetical protein AHAS_Ahas11G0245700 [Arachis hypogaea]
MIVTSVLRMRHTNLLQMGRLRKVTLMVIKIESIASSRPNKGGKSSGLGGGKIQPDAGQDRSGPTHTKVVELNIEEVDSEEDKAYVYESEAFVSLVSSYNEGGLLCKHAVTAIFRLKNMGYKSKNFVHKSLTMDVVRATYSYVIQPVNGEEYWILTGCTGTLPSTIVRPVGRPKIRRIKDPIEMVIGNKVRKSCQAAQLIPPHPAGPIPPPSIGLRMKQPIVRPPVPSTKNNLETLKVTSLETFASMFTFMPTPRFRPPSQERFKDID